MSLLANPLRGELRHNEPMSKHTSWRVGGPARQFFVPADIADLTTFMPELPAGENILWLGLGSNLLVRDGGFAGTVIAMHGRLAAIEIADLSVHVGAGAACAKVARVCARAGLHGASFFAGIPGTIGGALAMNAGAFGGETWRVVTQVTTVDRDGELHQRSPAEYQIAYREVHGPLDEGFVSCVLQLEAGDSAQEQAAIRTLLAKRSATQPTGKPSGGSTFRNPPGDYAARLLEACGLKGYRMGGAEISEKHANFVLNTGNATAQDIEDLIAYMHTQVERQHGVSLQTEVHTVGKRSGEGL